MSVAFDAVTQGAVAQGAQATPTNINHSVVDNTNGYIAVAVALGRATLMVTGSITGVTIGGQTASRIGFIGSGNGVNGGFFLYGRKSGDLGTGTIAVAVSLDDVLGYDIEYGIQSFTGVDQTTPLGTPVTAFGDSGTAQLDITDSATGDLIVYGLCQGSGGASAPLSGGATETERWDQAQNSNTAGGCGAGGHAPGASGSQTVGETFTSDNWGMVAVALKAASGTSNATATPSGPSGSGSVGTLVAEARPAPPYTLTTITG